MRIYLDTNIVIYAVQDPSGYGTQAAARLARARGVGDDFAVSDLVRMECRVKPLKTGDAKLLTDFDVFFTTADVHAVPLTTAVCDRATMIRATVNFKTIDALHLAAAVENGCDLFLTNDTRLNRFADLPVEVFP